MPVRGGAPRRSRVPSRSRSRARTPGKGQGGLEFGQIKEAKAPHPKGFASSASRTKAMRDLNYDTSLAIIEARDGDDKSLLTYQPTPSIFPPRPRTLAAGYDKSTETLRVRFRDGTPWEYYDVSDREWRNFKRVRSPGRYINRVLNSHPYSRGNF